MLSFSVAFLVVLVGSVWPNRVALGIDSPGLSISPFDGVIK